MRAGAWAGALFRPSVDVESAVEDDPLTILGSAVEGRSGREGALDLAVGSGRAALTALGAEREVNDFTRPCAEHGLGCCHG